MRKAILIANCRTCLAHVVLRAALEREEVADALMRAGMVPEADLVELSAMVALPGAQSQHPHSDVSPLSQRRIVTLWVALQDVESSMGPLNIYPAAPDEMAERAGAEVAAAEAANS